MPSESVVVDEDGIESHLSRGDPAGPARAGDHRSHGRTLTADLLAWLDGVVIR